MSRQTVEWIRLAVASGVVVGILLLVSVLAGLRTSDVAAPWALIWLNLFAFSLAWSRIREQASIPECLGMASVGTLCLPAIARLLHGAPLVCWLIGPVLVLAVLLATKRSSPPPRAPLAGPVVIGALLGFAVALVLLRSQVATYASAVYSDAGLLHPDFIKLEAIAQANGDFGVGRMGMMSDWPIRYHWLAYAWAGTLQSAAGSPAFLTTSIVLPLFSLAGMALLSASLVGVLSRSPWAPALGALLVIAGHPLADSSALVVNWDSPSHMASIPLLLGALLVVLISVSQPAAPATALSRPWALGLVGFLSFVTVGVKFSTAAVLCAALAASALLALALRTGYRRALGWLAATAVVAAAVSWLLLESGQETSGLLAVRSPDVGQPLGAIVREFGSAAWTSGALLPAAAALIFLFLHPPTRREPATLVAAGLLAAGLAPLWVLEDTRPNSTWVLSAAAAGLGVISATAVARASAIPTGILRGVRLPIVGLCVAVVTALVWAASIRYLTWTSWPFAYAIGLGAVAAVAALVMAGRDARRASAVGLVTMAALVVTPLAIPVAERLLPGLPPISPPTELLATPATPTAASGAVSDAPLKGWTIAPHPGEVIAYTDARLTPEILRYRASPYVFGLDWASLLGPRGSRVEALRRLGVVDAFHRSGDLQAAATLCADGVDSTAVVDSDGTVRLTALTCP